MPTVTRIGEPSCVPRQPAGCAILSARRRHARTLAPGLHVAPRRGEPGCDPHHSISPQWMSSCTPSLARYRTFGAYPLTPPAAHHGTVGGWQEA
jgi:hypothetical protein